MFLAPAIEDQKDGLPGNCSEVTPGCTSSGAFGHCLFSVRLPISRNTKLHLHNFSQEKDLIYCLKS